MTLEPIVPSPGTLARVDDVVRRLSGPPGRVDVSGLEGGAGAWFLTRWQRGLARPILVLTVGAGRVRRWADDLQHFAGGGVERGGEVVAIGPPEIDPYAELVPDRSTAIERLSALHRLGVAAPPRFVVVAAEAFVRRVLPPEALRSRSAVVAAGDVRSQDELIRLLVEGGYHRVRAVDLAGTFAVRGGLLDVFPPAAEEPARIEWDGDDVVAVRSFDPATQRTAGELPRVGIHPVTEILRGAAELRRARERLRELGDARGMPTRRIRELVEQVEEGAAFPGVETLLPAFHERLVSVAAYLPDGAAVCVDNPAAVTDVWRREHEAIERSFAAARERLVFEPAALALDGVEAAAECGARPLVLSVPPGAVEAASPRGWSEASAGRVVFGGEDNEPLVLELRQARRDRRGTAPLAPLARAIREKLESGVRVALTARTAGGLERLAALLRGHNLHGAAAAVALPGRGAVVLPAGAAEGAGAGLPGAALDGLREAPGFRRYVLEPGPLSRGFHLPADGVAWITEEEVFGTRAPRAGRPRPPIDPAALRSLAEGEYVVHAVHGIGRYEGLVRRVFDGVELDLLRIRYRDNDRLHVPVYHANQVSKYVGQGEPKLDRMGGASFAKAREKAEAAVRVLADELLRLHAQRKAHPGRPVAAADDAYRAFEAQFPFEETPDQSRAIAEVVADLEREAPMDRLVCGDVGFGKTEVALRAAFRVVWSGRQAAVLAPTTVLTQQHLATFRRRFERFPVRIEPLYRFQTKAEQAEVVRGVVAGEVDIVIGTHRLLSKDVHFKDLGLIVIDEEHRFGVAHKERLKRLRREVAVLTLTATPIPRTLHLAMSGLRDLSLVATAPEDRLAVRTTVAQADDELVRRALLRELSRDGQAFFVHNRVETIHSTADRLRALVPEARFGVAHGQMEEDALEQAMVDFVAGRFDVLVCTSIIESGLDIPRANTLIVDRADTLGLAQLYQIRGRVGRSRQQAYCYLLVPPFHAMTADARQRIDTLARFTALGSGFNVASMDLEIRGAGDLLGAEQSGNVAAVGFDMYCHLLEDAVARLRGEPPSDEPEPELTVDEAALLPDSYVDDVGQRLEFYQRLAAARGEEDVRDVAAELRDRFGPLPEETARLVELMAAKVLLRRMRAAGLEARGERVTVHLRAETPLDPAAVMVLVRRPGSTWRVTPELRVEWRAGAGDRDGSVARAAKVVRELSGCLRPGRE
ncbi:MAG: transcription-repair coupling factor [Deltaproteobacteria bacterium]|nr:transcription-repair coupling factor [Deltaproteobacteria bacterium]